MNYISVFFYRPQKIQTSWLCLKMTVCALQASLRITDKIGARVAGERVPTRVAGERVPMRAAGEVVPPRAAGGCPLPSLWNWNVTTLQFPCTIFFKLSLVQSAPQNLKKLCQ